MERHQIVQFLIDKYKFSTYLEIGVRDGNVFFTVEAKRKIAVDPSYSFSWKGMIKRYLTSFKGSSFYDCTSDVFFEKYASKEFSSHKLDIVLVDGMHEYQFALNDILNSLNHLSNNGIIVVHDCNPKTEEAACSFAQWKQRNFSGVWNGDVWRSIFYLRRARKDLEVFVLDTDHGIGVIRKKAHGHIPDHQFSISTALDFSFQDLDKNRDEYLNLKPVSFIEGF